ncbi:MAG: YqfQ family protein [Methanobacterium paludis]|nr:YqfQ family protein [Methanobacterium paludis]
MNLFSMLTNAQKAIQTAQSVLPMIQQFGPLIRNAPAILSALKSVPESEKADSDPKENTNQAEEPPVPSHKEEKKETRPKPDVKKTAVRKVPAKDNLRNSENMKTRPSRPKLYI